MMKEPHVGATVFMLCFHISCGGKSSSSSELVSSLNKFRMIKEDLFVPCHRHSFTSDEGDFPWPKKDIRNGFLREKIEESDGAYPTGGSKMNLKRIDNDGKWISNKSMIDDKFGFFSHNELKRRKKQIGNNKHVKNLKYFMFRYKRGLDNKLIRQNLLKEILWTLPQSINRTSDGKTYPVASNFSPRIPLEGGEKDAPPQLLSLKFRQNDTESVSNPLELSNSNEEEKNCRKSREIGVKGKTLKTDEDDEELPVHKRTSVQYSSLVGPSFLNASLHSKTHALAGQTARLTCLVKNLHNYTISWIRARDINLLTSGEVTYSSDNRFVAMNPSNGPRWVLKIHHVKLSDAGKYICQISTSAPISTAVTLLVTESSVEIQPAREVFLKVGSPVRLVCTLRGCPYPALPAWYRNGELQKNLRVEESTLIRVPTVSSTSISSPTSKSTVSAPEENLTINSTNLKKYVDSLPYNFSSEESEGLTNDPLSSVEGEEPLVEEVLIARVIFERPKATRDLSGTYSCTNTCTDPHNLTLHVLTGDEETAAMQHINVCAPLPFLSLSKFQQSFLLIFAIIIHSVYR
ncbi:UNVERIFIED_CONTAM: hypothetical protein RMT77_001592 [Armadillidium vulgare]